MKNHAIISTDAGKAFHKTEPPFIIKTLSELGIEEKFFNLIKNVYKQPKANIILNDEKCEGTMNRWNMEDLRAIKLLCMVL